MTESPMARRWLDQQYTTFALAAATIVSVMAVVACCGSMYIEEWKKNSVSFASFKDSAAEDITHMHAHLRAQRPVFT